MHPYNTYEGFTDRCLGRILYFLLVYKIRITSTLALKVTTSELFINGEKVATIKWIKDTDIPIFSFTEKYSEYTMTQTEHLNKLQVSCPADIQTDEEQPQPIQYDLEKIRRRCVDFIWKMNDDKLLLDLARKFKVKLS